LLIWLFVGLVIWFCTQITQARTERRECIEQIHTDFFNPVHLVNLMKILVQDNYSLHPLR